MALNLDDVLARIAMRTSHEEDEDFVDDVSAAWIVKLPHVNATRLESPSTPLVTKNRTQQRGGLVPTHADDRDAA
jgi:hypothetical protein